MATREVRPFRTLRGKAVVELEIKRSRFIAQAVPMRAETAVQEWLAAVRLAHPDANHHCFAYRLGTAGDVGRFSDDGEPGGTAGRPMMEVLLREELVDAAVVVTRYFGGVLLGAGGLTRAYSQGAAEAVRAAGFLEMRPHTELEVTVDYAVLGALEQLLLREGYSADHKEYGERVTFRVPVPAGAEAGFSVRVADLSAGAALLTAGPTVYLPNLTATS